MLTRTLDRTVQTLLSGTGDIAQTQVLDSYGVGYVVLDAPLDPVIERRLDGTPGLQRVSSVSSGSLWRVVPPGVRVRLLRPPAPAVTIPVDPAAPATTVDAPVPPVAGTPAPPTGDGTLRLAEAADPGWRASADGKPLAGRTVDGWAQAFAVPASATHVQVTYVDHRGRWLVAQGVLAFTVLLLALPSWRRRDDGLDEPEQDAPYALAPPAVPEPEEVR